MANSLLVGYSRSVRSLAVAARFLAIAVAANAQVTEHAGGKTLPHDKYVRVVSEADSPIEKTYIKTKDGLYIAAAIRKPKGPGPFPALIHFHGAPGGRGMEKLVEWSSGSTGGPVWERFLQEGYAVVVADYRNMTIAGEGITADKASYADDGVAVVEHVRKLGYVDPARISVYGVSLGGDVVMHLISRTRVHRAILGAGAPIRFLGVKGRPGGEKLEIDEEGAQKRISSIETPLLILVGTADGLIRLDRAVYEQMTKGGKKVRLDIFENGYHDFVMGPQGHAGRAEPLLDITLDALELTLKFVKGE